uniref:MaoC-like domain-containing protein n=2 Tax=Leersia perrieri TaxID=77586 RepID=A0A0D9WWG9_9ORYZ
MHSNSVWAQNTESGSSTIVLQRCQSLAQFWGKESNRWIMRASLRQLVAMMATPLMRSKTMTTAPTLLLKVGDTLCERRRFTEGEVEAYAGVSGDRNPVHLDDVFAREVGGFEHGCVVHGMLVASLFPALIAAHFPGAVYARQSLKFAAPVYVGKEVLVQVQALHIRPSATKYFVKFGTKCFANDNDNAPAIVGEALAVLPSLHQVPTKAPSTPLFKDIHLTLNPSVSMAGTTATSSSLRRMESVHRHLLPAPPPILHQNPLGATRSESFPVIIGGMVLDIHAKPSMQPHPGTTVPGMVKYISGGVARNIAECIYKLETRPFMISVVGKDMAGDFLLKYWRSAGLCTDGILQVDDVTTPIVSNVFDGSGELIAGVASVGAVEKFLSPSWICQFCACISNAPLLMIDANLSPESLEASCKIAHEVGVPVFFEPVSIVKSSRIAPIAKYITYTSPNEFELVAMANSLSPPEKYNFAKIDQFKNKAKAVEYLFEMLSPAMFFLLEKGIKFLLVTLGSHGVFVCCKECTSLMMDQQKSETTSFSTMLLDKLERCFPSNMLLNFPREGSTRTCVFHLPAVSASVVSLTGAGDCFVGGVISALCGGLDMMQSVAVGIAIAKASVESEANIPDKFSAATIAGG